jgi:hypothetical protein
MSHHTANNTERNVERAGDHKSTLTATTIRSWQELSVFAGERHIGYVVERNSNGRQFEARSPEHKHIGTFPTLRAAMRACASAP